MRDAEAAWQARAARWGLAPLSRLRVPLRVSGGALPDGTDDAPREAVTAPAEPRSARPFEPGTDPVRLYLTEIAKGRLLTAAQEAAIGRRIEIAQADLRRSLAAIPLVVLQLGSTIWKRSHGIAVQVSV